MTLANSITVSQHDVSAAAEHAQVVQAVEDAAVKRA